MGLFDSLLITWQDAAVEVQTHHLEDAMSTFRPGDRLVPAERAPGWQVFVETFHRDLDDPSTQRWLVALTWNGVWLDYAIAGDGTVRRNAAVDGLMRVWRDPRYSAWAFGRWAEWFADGQALESRAWNRQWSLLQGWQGGPILPFRRSGPNEPLGPLDRDEVVAGMEEALADRGRQRLAHELGWPCLAAERPMPTDPNAPLFAESDPSPPTGFAHVPPPAVEQASRWVRAADALISGDWAMVEHLVQNDRPSQPVPAWQAALDQTLNAVLPSRTLQPLTVRLLEWGAVPPAHVDDLPLLEWAVAEQGWGLDLLLPLRTACPSLDWVGAWPWWGQNGYLQAWADRPSASNWLEQDAQAWVQRCNGEPTSDMLHRPPEGWTAWTQYGGRLFAQDEAHDPLAAALANPAHAVSARTVQWLVEQRDAAGWTVPHMTRMNDRLRTLAQNDRMGSLTADWAAVHARFEQLLLQHTTPSDPSGAHRRKGRQRL